MERGPWATNLYHPNILAAWRPISCPLPKKSRSGGTFPVDPQPPVNVISRSRVEGHALEVQQKDWVNGGEFRREKRVQCVQQTAQLGALKLLQHMQPL